MAKKKTEDATPIEEAMEAMASENVVTNEAENIVTDTQAEGIPEAPVETKKTRASKKTSEGEATTTQAEGIPEAPVETKKTRASKKTSEGEATTTQAEGIPEDVKSILKCFPNEEELYVSKFGGVFPKDSEPLARGNAILYKNPFYKS